MLLYECVFIARNDVTQQQVEAIADTIGAQIDADNGVVPPAADEVRAARRRSGILGAAQPGYRINKIAGHYMLLARSQSRFRSGDGAPARPERGRAGFKTIRLDEIDEAPSAILSRKSDDRERNFRPSRLGGR
jgi:small subunit ribosomal protein S6